MHSVRVKKKDGGMYTCLPLSFVPVLVDVIVYDLFERYTNHDDTDSVCLYLSIWRIMTINRTNFVTEVISRAQYD